MTTTKDKIELAKSIFGNKIQKLNQNVSYITAKATSDSVDGKVYVKFDDDEEPIELVTLESVKENDIVQCILVGTEATVLGVVGRGDDVQRQISEIEGGDNHFFYFTEEEKPGHSGAYVANVEKEAWTTDATYLKAIQNGVELHEGGNTIAEFGAYKTSLANGKFKFDTSVESGVRYNNLTSYDSNFRFLVDSSPEALDVQAWGIYVSNLNPGAPVKVQSRGGDLILESFDPTEQGHGNVELISDGNLTILAGSDNLHSLLNTGNANIDRRGAKTLWIAPAAPPFTEVKLTNNVHVPITTSALNIDDPYDTNDICPITCNNDGSFTLTAKGIYKIHTHLYFRSATANEGLFNSRIMEGSAVLLEGVTPIKWTKADELTAQVDNDLIVKSDGTRTLKVEVRARLMNDTYIRHNVNYTHIIVEYLGSWN